MKLEILAIANEVYIPCLFFTKETNCRQNFCFISNLAAIVPTLSGVSFCFLAAHVCMCVCYHYQLWWERTTVNICSICSDSSCIFFAPFWHVLLLHRARPPALAALADLAALAVLAVLAALAASSRVSELHNCTSMALLCIHFLDHISQQKKTNTVHCARVLAFGHFKHFLRLVK